VFSRRQPLPPQVLLRLPQGRFLNLNLSLKPIKWLPRGGNQESSRRITMMMYILLLTRLLKKTTIRESLRTRMTKGRELRSRMRRRRPCKRSFSCENRIRVYKIAY
jgi:hypothetical protein